MVTTYNYNQKTRHDLGGDPLYHEVSVPVFKEDKIIEVVESIPYKTAVKDSTITNLGYMCEPKGILYPIYLEINGSYKKINIGKNGIYEFHSDDAEIIITSIQVPADIDFVLDYIAIVN